MADGGYFFDWTKPIRQGEQEERDYSVAPASELDTEQLHARLRSMIKNLEEMDSGEWAMEYGEDFAEAYVALDTKLSSSHILPQSWRWARTP